MRKTRVKILRQKLANVLGGMPQTPEEKQLFKIAMRRIKRAYSNNYTK